jgi:glycosyltransferase involved in cell wall biosynthesis
LSRIATVCVVAPVHLWDDVRVFHKEARTLAGAGYRVIVIARAPGREFIDGVEVVPARTATSSRFLRFVALPAVFLQAVRVKADVYHLHNPDTLPIALGLKMIGRKIVYDTHEDFSKKILIRSWMPAILRQPAARVVVLLEGFVSSIVDATIVTQAGVLGRVDRSAMLIGNPPRLESALLSRVADLAADISTDFNGLRAVYLGDINAARGLFEMIEALEIANETTAVRLWLVGPGSEVDLRTAAALPGWRYVDRIPRLPLPEQAFAYVSRADVGLVVIRDVGDHATIDSNKLYEYMAFGLPFIASNFKAWRDRLGGLTAGLFVKPGDAREIAGALIKLARNPAKRMQMGKRGRMFVEAHSWERESVKLLELYDRVLNAADIGSG